MVEEQIDLDKNPLERTDELKIVYDGPSFDGQMEISSLSKQLCSTEFLIREIVREYYSQRGFKEEPELKIYLKLHKGSFEEWISIIFTVDMLRNVVGIVLGGLILHFLTKKKDSSIRISMPIKIEKLVNNIKIVNNLEQLVSPLEKNGDKVKILSTKNPESQTQISFEEKGLLKEAIKDLKSQVDIEISIEEFFGNLLDISLSKNKYGFMLEETSRVIPVNFDKEPSIGELKKIFSERLKIKARATRKEGKIESLDIMEYDLKERENLKSFFNI
jgi:hypothetical protein